MKDYQAIPYKKRKKQTSILEFLAKSIEISNRRRYGNLEYSRSSLCDGFYIPIKSYKIIGVKEEIESEINPKVCSILTLLQENYFKKQLML